MKMNQFKRELLSREFPFLSSSFCVCGQKRNPDRWSCEHCGREGHPNFLDADEIKVVKIHLHLLDLTPWSYSYSWCNVSHEDFELAYAVGLEVIKLSESCNHRNGSGNRYETEADTIGSQLRSLNFSPNYIVLFKQDDTDDNGNGRRYQIVTIYKNKGDTQFAYEKAQLRRAYKEIVAELESA